MATLKLNFYTKPTLKAAKDLLGCFLVREIAGKVYKFRIVETEAYLGEADLASHSSKGRTKRTEIMYGRPGTAYLYLIYGMYWCLNIVAEKDGLPGAVLIRAIEPIESYVQIGKTDGPGKLCRELSLGKSFNGHDLTLGQELWLETGKPPKKITQTKRINVDYAGEWKDKRWRFVDPKSPCLSRKI